MKAYESMLELIGSTPLLRIKKTEEKNNVKASIFAKLEYFNPAGSVKDRAAKKMLLDAKNSGKLMADTVIIEPTSGNMGIALAAAAAVMGNKIIIVMPDSMSVERRMLMKAYGAKLVLTPGAKGMKGAIERANELSKEIDNSFVPGQFSNSSNAQTHFTTTGPEIWDGTDGKVDIFVAGVGTGGTITGVGEYLKSKNPKVKIIAVEPEASPFLSKGVVGPHKLQGIGAGFAPSVLNTEIYDEIITVKNEDAFEATRQIAVNEGVLVGISSGAAMCAAIEVGKRDENKTKNIVVILPDTGERYLSTTLFSDD